MRSQRSNRKPKCEGYSAQEELAWWLKASPSQLIMSWLGHLVDFQINDICQTLVGSRIAQRKRLKKGGVTW